MKIVREKSGLILVEAIVSIAIMSIGVVILGSIINAGVDSIALSRDYLTAQNLATEGAEIIKDIRDTNWLLKPNDRKCWLRLSPDSVCNDIVVFDKYYTLKKLNDKRDYLFQESTALDLEKGLNSPKFRMYLKDGMYSHSQSGADETNFYRSIKALAVDNSNYNSATFEVKTQWFFGAKIREVKRIFTIYNSIE